ncbi:MAG: DNA replication/repair protein RecF [Pseudomonadota bacterium]
MLFSRVSIRNVRVINNATLNPTPGINNVIGPNGSGKTSFLEALHILSAGHSFRESKIERIIADDASDLRVVADFTDSLNQPDRIAGVSRGRTGTVDARLDRQEIKRLSQLSKALPLVALHPESHQIISGGPTNRRKLVDWGVFHVEHTFHDIWRHYKRLLDQRNAALKAGARQSEIAIWDTGLADSGEKISLMRQEYLTRLKPILNTLAEQFEWTGNVALEYQRGWTADSTLAQALAGSLPRDAQYKTTQNGPHRAEIVIRDSGHDVRYTYSRGQIKLLTYLIRVAQAELLKESNGQLSVILCDDLAAELDLENQHRLLQVLTDVGYQVFVTSLAPIKNESATKDSAVFHVKHGSIAQVV